MTSSGYTLQSKEKVYPDQIHGFASIEKLWYHLIKYQAII